MHSLARSVAGLEEEVVAGFGRALRLRFRCPLHSAVEFVSFSLVLRIPRAERAPSISAQLREGDAAEPGAVVGLGELCLGVGTLFQLGNQFFSVLAGASVERPESEDCVSFIFEPFLRQEHPDGLPNAERAENRPPGREDERLVKEPEIELGEDRGGDRKLNPPARRPDVREAALDGDEGGANVHWGGS